MKSCYGCESFSRNTSNDNHSIPWCKKLEKETNALLPRCQNPSQYDSLEEFNQVFKKDS
jgi:hypothetical protein